MLSVFQNWSDLRVFLAVLRSGSTLAASKTLAMTQPTVARRIDTLEHALGLTLFERNTRGFQPTPAALELQSTAEAVEAAITGFAEAAHRQRCDTDSTIRFSAANGLFTKNFAVILDEFAMLHPHVRFEFMPTNKIVDLSGGQADVVIRFASQIDDPTLICRKLADAASTLYVSRRYVEKFGRPTSPAEFSGHKFIVYQGESIPSQINNWLLERIRPDQIVMTCGDFESMITAIEMGTGVGPLPVSNVHPSNTRVLPCFDPPAEAFVPIWLLANPSAYKRAEVKAFFSFFAPRYAALLHKRYRKFVMPPADSA